MTSVELLKSVGNLVIVSLFLLSSLHIGGFLTEIYLTNNMHGLYFALDLQSILDSAYSVPEKITYYYYPPLSCVFVPQSGDTPSTYACGNNKVRIPNVFVNTRVSYDAQSDFLLKQGDRGKAGLGSVIVPTLSKEDVDWVYKGSFQAVYQNNQLDACAAPLTDFHSGDDCAQATGYGTTDIGGIHDLFEEQPLIQQDEQGNLVITKNRVYFDTLCGEERTSHASLKELLNTILNSFCSKRVVDGEVIVPFDWNSNVYGVGIGGLTTGSREEGTLCLYRVSKYEDVNDHNYQVLTLGSDDGKEYFSGDEYTKDYFHYAHYCVNFKQAFSNTACKDKEFLVKIEPFPDSYHEDKGHIENNIIHAGLNCLWDDTCQPGGVSADSKPLNEFRVKCVKDTYCYPNRYYYTVSNGKLSGLYPHFTVKEEGGSITITFSLKRYE